jgi:hypothetical protein
MVSFPALSGIVDPPNRRGVAFGVPPPGAAPPYCWLRSGWWPRHAFLLLYLKETAPTELSPGDQNNAA